MWSGLVIDPRHVSFKAAFNDACSMCHPMLVLLWVAVALTVDEYLFLPGSFSEMFPDFANEHRDTIFGLLSDYVWWDIGMLVLWVIIPLGISKAFGFRANETGIRVRGSWPKMWIYLAMLVVMVPGVWWASTREGFQNLYPFIGKETVQQFGGRVLVCWWLLYAFQFFCLEYLFRGFMIFNLERSMGLIAIPVMCVPYCMIHYHKPMPEALGAIGAGLALGWMALRTRSIFGGWMLHCAVAVMMDTLSLWRADALPSHW